MHDPTIPESYFLGWPVPDAGQIFAGNLQFFTPSINSLALARRYGVGYVLIGPGLPVPAGMTAVTRIPVRFSPGAYLILARVPDAPRFTFTAATGDEVVSARHPDDASYVLSVRVPHPSKLVLRVTCVPGWHVTADGRPLDVRCYEGAFLAVQVPAGTHTIVARYWPRDFTIGIVFALLALLALVLAPFFPKFWRIAPAVAPRVARQVAAARRRPAPARRMLIYSLPSQFAGTNTLVTALPVSAGATISTPS
jgi:hypothetical protein